MSLINADYVKDKFPLWNKYFLDSDGDADEEVLTDEIELAEAFYSNYLIVTEDDLTEAVKLDLLVIVKKRGFDRRHGDVEFEHRPQILKDYDALVERLDAIKNGKEATAGKSISSQNVVTMTAKPRRFETWFNDTEEDASSSE